MKSFLSFPPIAKMRKEMKNDIHFKVTVHETIRYIISKRIMQAYNNNYQNNPIIMVPTESFRAYYTLIFYFTTFQRANLLLQTH